MKYSLSGIANNWIDRHRRTQRIRSFWQQYFSVELEWRIEKMFKPWGPSEVRLIQPRQWLRAGQGTGEYIDRLRPR